MPDDTKRTHRERLLARAIVVGLVVLLLYGLAHTKWAIDIAWRQTRGTRYNEPVVRWALRCHGEGIEKKLAQGQIRAGQSVSDVMEAHGPFTVETFGQYQTLSPPGYRGPFESFVIIAQNGRLVAAHWRTCIGACTFFSEWPAEDEQDYVRLWHSFQNEQMRLRRSPQAAVIGGVGVMDPWQLKPTDGQ